MDRNPDAEQAVMAVKDAVVKIVEAEGFLEDAARLHPQAADELRRLVSELNRIGIEAIEAQRPIR